MSNELYWVGFLLASPLNSDISLPFNSMDFCMWESVSEMVSSRIDDLKSEGFSWRQVSSIASEVDRLPVSDQEMQNCVSQSVDSYGEIVRRFGLGQKWHRYFIKRRGYGRFKRGDFLVVSHYRWAANISVSDREAVMAEHLKLERQQPLFHAIRFNEVIPVVDSDGDKNIPTLDFIFEGYCNSSSDISTIYSDDLLQKMRRHSEGFIDVATRQLAYGKVLTTYSNN